MSHSDAQRFIALCQRIISIVKLQSRGDFDDIELRTPVCELEKQAKALGFRFAPVGLERKRDHCSVNMLWPHGEGVSVLAWRIKTPELKLGVKYGGIPFKVCEKPEELKLRIVAVLENWIRHVEATGPDAPPATENLDEMITGPALAQRYNVDTELLRKRLDYWRKMNPGSKDWTEIENRAMNEARYLYRLGAVLSIVNDLKSDG